MLNLYELIQRSLLEKLNKLPRTVVINSVVIVERYLRTGTEGEVFPLVFIVGFLTEEETCGCTKTTIKTFITDVLLQLEDVLHSESKFNSIETIIDECVFLIWFSTIHLLAPQAFHPTLEIGMFSPFSEKEPVLILRLKFDVGVLVEAHWWSAKSA